MGGAPELVTGHGVAGVGRGTREVVVVVVVEFGRDGGSCDDYYRGHRGRLEE